MVLKDWYELPHYMKNESVRRYYDVLCKKSTSLKLKRLFDVVVSAIMLVVALPAMLVIAVMIKCDSRGPVFFCQKRVTQYGRVFRILKFRTMVDKAESKGSQVTVGDDNRITRVGAMLRRLRLDELPQLFNVLAGDMTYVGTRPEVVRYVRRYGDEYMATLLLPAGITSLASIRYKDEDELLEQGIERARQAAQAGIDDDMDMNGLVDDVYVNEILPGKMKYNLEGIERFSLLGELRIMVSTVLAVLR
jgi:lipopolysaccharide/colanic/teichoic acid biosynthesis glycosyltransferase